MEELLELLLKKVAFLEKKVEMYYQMLKIENELDFIINGTYLMEEDVNNILLGNY